MFLSCVVDCHCCLGKTRQIDRKNTPQKSDNPLNQPQQCSPSVALALFISGSLVGVAIFALALCHNEELWKDLFNFIIYICIYLFLINVQGRTPGTVCFLFVVLMTACKKHSSDHHFWLLRRDFEADHDHPEAWQFMVMSPKTMFNHRYP